MKIDSRALLQIFVVLGSIVPISAGLYGALCGVGIISETDINLDSHFRYLSGLLLSIGIGFLSCVHNIENKGERFKLLTIIVFVGGIARLYGALIAGFPGLPMQFGLVMELVVTPLLYVWQRRVARS